MICFQAKTCDETKEVSAKVASIREIAEEDEDALAAEVCITEYIYV